MMYIFETARPSIPIFFIRFVDRNLALCSLLNSDFCRIYKNSQLSSQRKIAVRIRYSNSLLLRNSVYFDCGYSCNQFDPEELRPVIISNIFSSRDRTATNALFIVLGNQGKLIQDGLTSRFLNCMHFEWILIPFIQAVVWFKHELTGSTACKKQCIVKGF